MVGTNLIKRKSRSERVAEQAWDQLGSALAAAGGSARAASRQGSRLVGRAGTTADEAWHRAQAAVDALAGRRRPTPWLWLAGAAAVGAVVGWAAASAAHAVFGHREEPSDLKFVEADVPQPTAVAADG